MVQVRAAVDAASAAGWLASIDAHPAWQERDRVRTSGFNPHSSSLCAAEVASLDVAAIARRLLAGEIGALCRSRLGEGLACDLDQCWVRRQYAPGRYPDGHAPHSWHQDGALGFDFLDPSPADGGLLSMLTCWIALTPCGVDAPGLEFVDRPQRSLLPLAALGAEAVRADRSESEFVRPDLQAGDALVFDGGVLHHTHVRPQMNRDRTSLELRFFAAGQIPFRLRDDRFLALP
ncbi:MAG: phytanoyl-CoA dioxygenase family protein [Caldimonas sp.]